MNVPISRIERRKHEDQVLEIRDIGTFIPMLCVDMNHDNDDQRYLLRRCGYPCDAHPNILMTRLSGRWHASVERSYAWGGRTFPVAHNWIIENWEKLTDGDVCRRGIILGETQSQRYPSARKVY